MKVQTRLTVGWLWFSSTSCVPVAFHTLFGGVIPMGSWGHWNWEGMEIAQGHAARKDWRWFSRCLNLHALSVIPLGFSLIVEGKYFEHISVKTERFLWMIRATAWVSCMNGKPQSELLLDPPLTTPSTAVLGLQALNGMVQMSRSVWHTQWHQSPEICCEAIGVWSHLNGLCPLSAK